MADSDTQQASPLHQTSSLHPMSGQRTSHRLREKHQFSMRRREDVLDKIHATPYDNCKSYAYLQPRKLINNFMKGTNTYNNPDKDDLLDEMSDEFIKDSSTSDSESSENADSESSSPPEGSIKRKSRNARRKLIPSEVESTGFEEESSDDDHDLAKPLRTHKQRVASSSSDAETSDGDEPIIRKKRPKNVIDSDDSSDSDAHHSTEEALCKEKMSPTHFEDFQDASSLEGPPVLDRKDGGGFDNDHQNDSMPICLHEEALRQSTGSDIDISDCSRSERSDSSDQVKWSPSHKKIDSSSGSSALEASSREHDERTTCRRPSLRARRLLKKKRDWERETLGQYQNERKKVLSKKRKQVVNTEV